ncbi:polysaccharide pyruvyl transferase family protein [Chryseobacterium sp.]|jgi:polysaccharide pyruvyl transferase WcaK-like protein|uniref:polysaccharide pyruvyl transferase family protein n=1 Tax=Chryseobacterium sp. TaxID=1871047 RepID=UPI0028456D8C|nr:polysaccharide pyruvyl transferase family protein [Chryseobacterium sp.]MDR3022551.1 polysaccharide pyruvyl transferase family protein [Chryseobacterium sp.]
MEDKEILIINQGYIRYNLGDQAIRISMNRFFKEKNYLVDYSFLTAPNDYRDPLPDTDYIKNKHAAKNNYKKVSRIKIVLSIIKWLIMSLPSIIRNLSKKKYKYVIVGGGQLINSSNSFYPHSFSYSIYLWSFFSRILNRKLVFLGVGANRKFNFWENFFYKKALKNASHIIVRDNYTKESLRKNFNVDSVIMPDIAFYDYDEVEYTKSRKFLSVNIYSYEEYNQNYNINKEDIVSYYNRWIELIKENLEEEEIVLFSTTPTDHYENCQFLDFVEKNKIFDGKKIILENITDLRDLNDLYGNSYKIISGRMHAILIGIKKGVVPVVFEISDKLSTFKREYIDDGIKLKENKNQIKDTLEKYFKDENI